MMEKIRVLIVDDHSMFRTGIVHLLQKSMELIVVGEANNGQEAIDLMPSCQPDIVLMDVQLPVINGIMASQVISGQFPNTKILALSQNSEHRTVLSMIKAGATGYVRKEGTIEELKMAIKALIEGSSYFSLDISSALFAHFENKSVKKNSSKTLIADRITDRELEVLKFVAEELSNKEIAAKLFISPRTVETHKRNLIQKLKVKNAVGLVKYYLQQSDNQGLTYGNPVQSTGFP